MTIFTRIGCAIPSNIELVGTEGVTEANMGQCLGIIEQRANEVLQLYAATHDAGRDSSGADAASTAPTSIATILDRGPQERSGVKRFDIVPPSVSANGGDSDGSDDEMEVKPLNREELLARAMRTVAKRGERKEAKKRGARVKAEK
jgi:hypothetical protein